MNANITAGIHARDEIVVSVQSVYGKPYARVLIADELTLFVNDKEQAEKLARLLLEAASSWEAELAAQEQALEQELERMKRDRNPILLVALDNALADVIDTSCHPLQGLFIQQWIAGNPLALAIAPEKQIITALMPHWRAQNEN